MPDGVRRLHPWKRCWLAPSLSPPRVRSLVVTAECPCYSVLTKLTPQEAGNATSGSNEQTGSGRNELQFSILFMGEGGWVRGGYMIGHYRILAPLLQALTKGLRPPPLYPLKQV